MSKESDANTPSSPSADVFSFWAILLHVVENCGLLGLVCLVLEECVSVSLVGFDVGLWKLPGSMLP